jgi:hypothetical protein
MATRIGPRKSPTSPRPPVGNPGGHPVFAPIARFARRLTDLSAEREPSLTVALADRSR